MKRRIQNNPTSRRLPVSTSPTLLCPLHRVLVWHLGHFCEVRLLPTQTRGRILRLSRIQIFWRNNGSQSNQLALTLPLKRQCSFRNSKVYPALPSSPYQIGRAGNIFRPYSHCANPSRPVSRYDTDRRRRSHKLLDITPSLVLDFPSDRN